MLKKIFSENWTQIIHNDIFFNQASDTGSGEPPIIYTLLYLKEFYKNFKSRFPIIWLKMVVREVHVLRLEKMIF